MKIINTNNYVKIRIGNKNIIDYTKKYIKENSTERIVA